MAKSKVIQPNYIVYVSSYEMIVTTPKKEKKIIKLYFKEGGRDIEEYERGEIYTNEVQILSGSLIVG